MNVVFGGISRGVVLPPSIRFRRETTVAVTIHRDPGDGPGDVHFEVVNGSAAHGEASITQGQTLAQSGQVTVRGDRQTTPGGSGQLRIRATFQGNQVGQSVGFSVCAHPCGMENGPQHQPIDAAHPESGPGLGMKVWMRVESDSGQTADLDAVEEREQVSGNINYSGALTKAPPPPKPSGYQPAANVEPDRHRLRIDVTNALDQAQLHGQQGGWSNDQLDVLICPRCGITEQHPAPIRNSGYRVTRTILTDGQNRLKLRVTKQAMQCTVGVFTSAAGPSPPLQVELEVPRQQVQFGSKP